MTFCRIRKKIKRVLTTRITPRRTTPTLNALPQQLRGPSNNKYGGHQCQYMRAFRGSKFGAANVGRKFAAEERAAWEKEWRKRESE